MHFDDRLATVLALPVSGTALARIQYRQLVDILGRARPAADFGPLHEEGLIRLLQLAEQIPASERARMVGDADRPIANPRLLALLAEAEPQVATSAIAAARLDEEAWLALIPALPVRARGIVRHRRDLGPRVDALLERLGVRDRALPPVVEATAAQHSAPVDDIDAFLLDCVAREDALDQAKAQAAAQEITRPLAPAPVVPLRGKNGSNDNRRTADAGIGAIVRRIEEFRRARESGNHAAHSADAPFLPLGDLVHEVPRGAVSVDFATDAEGRITWVDGPLASALVGFSLSGAADRDGEEADAAAPPPLVSQLRARQPLRAAPLAFEGAPAISGEWLADAVARFDPVSGRFTGYCGRLRRPLRIAPVAAQPSADQAAADNMRQILHELKNPANAIQVAAEIIQQQLYGPAPHEYRALAAAIAGDVAQILAGFDELDRLVKLESGVMAPGAGECDLALILTQTVSRLQAWTAPRRSGFVQQAQAASLPIRLDCQEAERMIWRLLAALAGSTAPDEQLALRWWADSAQVRVEMELPAALAGYVGDDLFAIPAGERGSALSAGSFGIGFTLRLAAAEARAAGGTLMHEGGVLRLDLPGLTGPASSHSNNLQSRVG
ncbi:HAMP domain-containing histidine kinase [Novosphingobium colocasiae]|uniref:histidine kinase n=1 Tax=Novosphingobium colocasiae TaxID=1256513 RepID=A0A918PKU7_9SPHN|nr:HAMP domain-containing histidine kinase [Novosphingobium colocasiae]GGZ13069.1 hypothetical protein GCM10011614_30280 [Novosphingobium colocasiae]